MPQRFIYWKRTHKIGVVLKWKKETGVLKIARLDPMDMTLSQLEMVFPKSVLVIDRGRQCVRAHSIALRLEEVRNIIEFLDGEREELSFTDISRQMDGSTELIVITLWPSGERHAVKLTRNQLAAMLPAGTVKNKPTIEEQVQSEANSMSKGELLSGLHDWRAGLESEALDMAKKIQTAASDDEREDIKTEIRQNAFLTAGEPAISIYREVLRKYGIEL